ncbi:MAG: DUF58 domain-containing protein [Candidatus Magnetominusculus sp. LBB02]|nr:DUF58 domain-containing protein [Candidatus Magnetominusculus sp. LBB02]
MLATDVIKNIRRVEIKTRRMAADFFTGHYRSVFKGRGMEFDEVRQYTPGDDIRSIDWNVTARMGEPFIKKFIEERELTIILLLDLSRSGAFATTTRLKRNLAAELSSLLALSAVRNNDKAGLIAFTDRIEKFIPPAKGLKHVLRVVRESIYLSPQGRGTDIAAALEYLSKVVRHRAVVFIVSDFHAPQYEKSLAIANKRHDVIAVTLTDPVERALPNVGLITLEDAETGELFDIDSSSTAVRRHYKEKAAAMFDERRRLFRKSGVDHIDISTDVPYIKTLIRFFRMRERRLNR